MNTSKLILCAAALLCAHSTLSQAKDIDDPLAHFDPVRQSEELSKRNAALQQRKDQQLQQQKEAEEKERLQQLFEQYNAPPPPPPPTAGYIKGWRGENPQKTDVPQDWDYTKPKPKDAPMLQTPQSIHNVPNDDDAVFNYQNQPAATTDTAPDATSETTPEATTAPDATSESPTGNDDNPQNYNY